jgi:hypothetical protein
MTFLTQLLIQDRRELVQDVTWDRVHCQVIQCVHCEIWDQVWLEVDCRVENMTNIQVAVRVQDRVMEQTR